MLPFFIIFNLILFILFFCFAFLLNVMFFALPYKLHKMLVWVLRVGTIYYNYGVK
jgi:hypothetical protein